MTQMSPCNSLLSDRELATTLAALRHWQRAVPEKDARSYSPLHFKSVQPLLKLEIDALCEKLNRNDTRPVNAALHRIRAILWRSADRWDADKQWNSETIEDVAGVLIELGLKP